MQSNNFYNHILYVVKHQRSKNVISEKQPQMFYSVHVVTEGLSMWC